MQGQDVYMKLTDPTGKRAPIITDHRVWDRELFINTQIDRHTHRAQGDDKRIVSLVSVQDYRRSRGYKTI